MNSLGNFTFDISALDWKDLLSVGSLITSIIFIAAIIAIRGFLIRYVRKDTEIIGKDQRRWIIRIKNTSAVLIFVGLILIWAPQIHTVALSIAAFAAALVIATKEMILCLTGAIMRATSQPFKVGDWITIDNITGEVIDLDAFAFRLQEVDMVRKSYQFTGRTISIPNSKLFSAHIENENFFKFYIYEDVRVAVQFNDIDPAEALSILTDIAEEYFNKYRTDAKAFHKKIRKRAGVDIGSADPVFDLTTSELGHYQFHVRFFLPTAIAAEIGSNVSKDFLARIYKLRQAVAQAKEAKEIAEAEKENGGDGGIRTLDTE
jgi:small-conductance mechanosensitive channel